MSKTTLTISLSRPHPNHYTSENGPLFTHLLMPETWEPFLSSWQAVFSVLSPNASQTRLVITSAPHPSSTVLHPNVGLQTQPNCSLPTFPLASSNPFFTGQPVTFQKYISNHITACWKHFHEAASRNAAWEVVGEWGTPAVPNTSQITYARIKMDLFKGERLWLPCNWMTKLGIPNSRTSWYYVPPDLV